MIVFWVLWMLWIFGMISAWGVREDEKRRAKRKFDAFIRVATAIQEGFNKIAKQMKLWDWQIKVLKQILMETNQKPYYYNARSKSFSAEGHTQYVRGDGSMFDPSVKEQ